jgi:hypothetical protein
MALVNIDNGILLEPGDVVKFVFKLTGGNQVLFDEAIRSIKTRLAADKRFNYQGSEMVWIKDENGVDIYVMNVYIQVRKNLKESSDALTVTVGTQNKKKVFVGEPQLAGMSGAAKIVIALSTAFSMVCGAAIAWSSVVKQREKDTTINGILMSDVPADVKKAALAAVQGGIGTGEGLAIAGGGLATLAIIGAVIWLLSQGRAGSRSASSGGQAE